jgi:hypothetical protein
MIDAQKHGGAILAWFIFIIIELILLVTIPALSIFIGALVLCAFCWIG